MRLFYGVYFLMDCLLLPYFFSVLYFLEDLDAQCHNRKVLDCNWCDINLKTFALKHCKPESELYKYFAAINRIKLSEASNRTVNGIDNATVNPVLTDDRNSENILPSQMQISKDGKDANVVLNSSRGYP